MSTRNHGNVVKKVGIRDSREVMSNPSDGGRPKHGEQTTHWNYHYKNTEVMT